MSEPQRNKNGLTEAEFLARYDASVYDRPSVTVDTVLLYVAGTPSQPVLRTLLIERGDHPSIGKWAVPGGFVQMDETVLTAAHRETREETGIDPQWIESFEVFSEPHRDPRTRVITVAFFALFQQEIEAHAGDDAAHATWFNWTWDIMNRSREQLVVRFHLGDGDQRMSFTATYAYSPSLYRPTITIDQPTLLAADHTLILATAWYRLVKEQWRSDRHEALAHDHFTQEIIAHFLQV